MSDYVIAALSFMAGASSALLFAASWECRREQERARAALRKARGES